MEGMTQEQRALADAAFAQKLNVVHHAYVDICGDLVAGALLGQILYWFGSGKDGRSRARIVKDGRLWIAKARADWWDEIRISAKQYDRAAKILREKGFVTLKTYKFAGNPTTHISIEAEAINKAIDAWKLEQVKTILPKGEERAEGGYSPTGNNGITETGTTEAPDGEEGNARKVDNVLPVSVASITESTAETTEESTEESTQENTRTARQPDQAPAEGASLARHAATVEGIESDFETVWSEYPRKEGKQKARRAFEKAVRGMGTRKQDGTPYTAAEIMAETVIFAQYIARRLEAGELEPRYIPSGGAWFEREGWTDDTPSISSTFDDLLDGIDYNRNISALRRCAGAFAGSDSRERASLWDRLKAIRAALPY